MIVIYYVFNFIQTLLKKEEIELDLKNIFFKLNFEKVKRRALNIRLLFPLCKDFLVKGKKKKDFQKNIIFVTYILIFAIKMFQFI